MTILKFKHKSYCDVTFRAREMALMGCTSDEISAALNMHLMACERVVQEAKAHNQKLSEVLLK
jgi:hypothetical protein